MADRETASEDMVPVSMYTETLARLYMRQGHVDKALRIYRHLAAQEPGDLDLQDQINAIEHQLTIAADMAANTPAQALPIPVDWPASPEANALEANLPKALPDAHAYAALPAAQVSREAKQAQQVIAQLEGWLRVLRRRELG